MYLSQQPPPRPPSTVVISPTRLLLYAQAFRFSSGRGRCFSPGFKAWLAWQRARLEIRLLDRYRLHWWRMWWGRD